MRTIPAKTAFLLLAAGLALAACQQQDKPGGNGNPDPATESPSH